MGFYYLLYLIPSKTAKKDSKIGFYQLAMLRTKNRKYIKINEKVDILLQINIIMTPYDD